MNVLAKRYFLLLSLLFIFGLNKFALIFSADFYWENPISLSNSDSRFPICATSNNSENNLTVIVWEEIEIDANEKQKGKIWISGQVSSKKNPNWKKINRFAGPFNYSGEVPNIISATVSKKGTIAIAIQSDTTQITIFRSLDEGDSFEKKVLENPTLNLVAPKIYTTARDGFILFATQGENESFSVMISKSRNGLLWSEFEKFEPALNMTNAFYPVLVSFGQNDLVVFQASFNTGSRLSYQLHSTISADDCNTWTSPSMITDASSVSSNQLFSNYHNQRPDVFYFNGKIYLAWEKSYYSSENAQIYFTTLNDQGRMAEKPVQISTGSGNASYPILFAYDNTLSILWFDTRRGTETIYMAQQTGYIWQETSLSGGSASCVFGLPTITNSKDLNIFWQQNRTNGTARIYQLSPDRSVSKPSLRPTTFTVGKRSTSEKVSVRVIQPEDSSGISGFSWIFTNNPDEEPPNEFMNLPSSSTLTGYAKEDGEWFFKVKSLDYAGNWSSTQSIAYVKDTTPPGKPQINYPETDESGFVFSNTFPVSWNSPLDDDIAGYTYSLEYLEDIPNTFPKEESELEFPFKPSNPPARILTSKLETSWRNRDNGFYVFSVAAIDEVGNIGESSSIKLYLNKYIPYTTITVADARPDEFGTIGLNIYGRGFTYDGEIEAIYIDKDGSSPYDRILTKDAIDYQVYSDRRIGKINLSDLEEGSYRIGLLHSTRGLYMSGRILTVTNFGTVKIGDYTYEFTPPWKTINNRAKHSVQITDVLIWSIFVLAFFGLLFSIHGIAGIAKDGIIIKQEVHALLTGDIMPHEKKQKTAELKNRGLSLRFKLIFFTAGLIMMIILLISIPLGYLMTSTQEQTLAKGLNDRANVLLESLTASVRTYLPSENLLELSFLPQQSTALEEARYTTILGLSSSARNTNLNYIWATNDPAINDKIDAQNITYGSTRLLGENIETILKECESLNTKTLETVGETAKGITDLTAEGVSLALRTDSKSIERRDEIQNITRQLSEKLTLELAQFSQSGSGSIPKYNPDKLDRENTTFLFYKPVLYRQGSEQNFVRGIILLELSTENLLNTLNEARKDMILTVSIIALLALTIGTVLSLLMALIIVKPIRTLASHVAMIRDTTDKEELAGKDIKLKTRDEIGLLGEIVNDMTHGLVKAAAAQKDLTVGKEVQKMFIPLETDEQGKKLTTASIEDDYAQFFGYYEGAKGVSGDYFDYLKLDDRHFAIIKCDVSGKGVPAALIMVEVATLFLNYFKDWSFKTNGTNLTPIVSQINDLIESRGFKGRFAAFTLCLFDSHTGDVHFCNAGDNLIHLYDASEKKKKTIQLAETPASGVFPTFMVDMKGGYPVQKLHLDKGDVLFLYTDGIEEAKRMFRDENLKQIVCAEPGLEPEAPHGFHSVGQDGEEMSPERVNGIIEAVFSRSTFSLEKYHNPIPGEILEFDFSNLNGSAGDAIMALVSVEKIFRMYNDPKATDFDTVQVDKKIDEFLTLHFKQYENYCSHKQPHPEFKEYLQYKRVREDDQYDDLTLMAIKKK